MLALLGTPADRYRHFDFVGFYLGSRALLEGLDPYDPRVWLALHVRVGSEGYGLLSGAGYGYPLPTALLTLPFALLPLETAAPLWLVVQLALAGLGLWAFARAALAGAFRRDAPVLFALGAASQATAVLIWTGQVTGFLLAAAAFGLTLLSRSRQAAAGAALGLLALKAHLFLWFAPVLLLTLERRAGLRLAAGGLAVVAPLLAASFALMPDWPGRWLATVSRLQGLDVSRANAWGLAPAGARWLGWVVLAGALAVLVVWWRARRPPRERVLTAGLALSLLGAPYSWSYDSLVLFPAVAVVLKALGGLGGAARASGLVVLALLVDVAPWLLHLETFRTGAEPLGGLVPLGLFALVVGTDLAAARSAGAPALSRREHEEVSQ